MEDIAWRRRREFQHSAHEEQPDAIENHADGSDCADVVHVCGEYWEREQREIDVQVLIT
jgi:hypothetical protein